MKVFFNGNQSKNFQPMKKIFLYLLVLSNFSIAQDKMQLVNRFNKLCNEKQFFILNREMKQSVEMLICSIRLDPQLFRNKISVIPLCNLMWISVYSERCCNGSLCYVYIPESDEEQMQNDQIGYGLFQNPGVIKRLTEQFIFDTGANFSTVSESYAKLI